MTPYGAADLAMVDALARLALAARRAGIVVRVAGASADLRDLVAFAGLGDVVRLEGGGQPEPGEQPGVEEVVDVADPPG